MQVTRLGLILFQPRQDRRYCAWPHKALVTGVAIRLHPECGLILQLDSYDTLKSSRAGQVKDWLVLTVP
jgi:hypothetical protein